MAAMALFLVGAVFSYAHLVIGGIFLILTLATAVNMTYRRFRVMLIVKSDKIALEKGFIGRQSIEINTKNVKTIQVTQSVMQRILDTGDILVASSGTDEYEIIVPNMPNPHVIRDIMQKRERAHGSEEASAD
jgi:uncharacterized membrane protein YdbT with pleckstrin-like domain